MIVKDLKELLSTMPEDADVMMYLDRMIPISTVQSGTVENLEPTGQTLFGIPVVGGDKKPVVFLCK